MKERIYYYRGSIERGNGRPGYDWVDGYSENSENGSPLYPWSTKKECRAEAKRDGVKAVFRNVMIEIAKEMERS